MIERKLIPVNHFINIFDFDYTNGLVYFKECKDVYFFDGDWRRFSLHNNKVGKPAFNTIEGKYLHGRFNSISYKAHRVLYCTYHKGPQVLEIDHIDQNKLNNRIDNLRASSHTLNMLNRGDKSLTPLRTGNYQAKVVNKGKSVYLGTYPTEIIAIKVMENYRLKHNLMEIKYHDA